MDDKAKEQILTACMAILVTRGPQPSDSHRTNELED
jgi:hypothetical protein